MSVDQSNIAFWNELCGSGLARRLGVADDKPESLRRFDEWYLNLYPYLADHVPFKGVVGQKVLEIGLGYGTVAQKLMEADVEYHGLDIADGPVAMARHRAALIGKSAAINQGSALAIPYPDSTFDHVVSIGCLHHTGNLSGAFLEVHRVLKPGGRAMIMVYNALSYRQWWAAPRQTFRRLLNPCFDWTNADPRMRKAYDANQDGQAAPSTTFISSREANLFLGKCFKTVNVIPRNIGDDFLLAVLLPRSLKRALFESTLGLDLYIECIK